MELRELWKVVRRRWWLVALPSLAALTLVALNVARTPGVGRYGSTMHFTAAQPPGSEITGYEDSRYYPWLASEYVIDGLTDWVATGAFAEEVSAELTRNGTEIPAAQIAPHLHADNDRAVMALYLDWHDADQLRAMTEASIVVMQERARSYFPQMGREAAVVVPLDQVSVSPMPPPLLDRFGPLIRVGVGVGVGLGLAFLVDYLDPTVRERSELESLGLKVLAEIPRRG
jgi:capsular polysaccharide biosynthesis protein